MLGESAGGATVARVAAIALPTEPHLTIPSCCLAPTPYKLYDYCPFGKI